MLKLSLLIEARERVTGTVRRIRSAIGGMARDGERDTNRLGRSMDRLGSSAGRVNRSFTFAGARAGLTATIRKVRELAGRAGMRGLELAARGAGFAIGRTLRAAGGLALRGAAIAAGGAGLLGGWLTGGVIGVGSKFEQFQIVLENTEGSALKAKRAMAWVKDFSKRTPYELEDVMEAFVALKAFGIDPTAGALESLGNASSGMNKPLMQAIEMMADAQTGEFERLKEFGVRAKQTGDKVAFTYMKAGREVTVTSRKSAAEIQRALMGIFDARFGGMMDRQSRTLAGLWSNLKDSFTNFQLDIANAGIFDWVKNRIQIVLDKVSELARSGKLQEWAEKISAWMERAGDKVWDFATKTDWNKLGSDLMMIAGAIRDVASAVNWLTTSLRQLPSLPDILSLAPSNWPSLFSRGGGFLPSFGRGSGAPSRPAPAPRRMPGGAPGWSVRGGRGAPALGPAMRQRPLVTQQRAEVGGKLDITVRTAPGTTASVNRLATNNRKVPLVVNRGALPLGA